MKMIIKIFEHAITKRFLADSFALSLDLQWWLIGIISNQFFDRIGVPIILQAIRKGKRVADEKNGAALYAKLSRAVDDNDMKKAQTILEEIFK